MTADHDNISIQIRIPRELWKIFITQGIDPSDICNRLLTSYINNQKDTSMLVYTILDLYDEAHELINKIKDMELVEKELTYIQTQINILTKMVEESSGNDIPNIFLSHDIKFLYKKFCHGFKPETIEKMHPDVIKRMKQSYPDFTVESWFKRLEPHKPEHLKHLQKQLRMPKKREK